MQTCVKPRVTVWHHFDRVTYNTATQSSLKKALQHYNLPLTTTIFFFVSFFFWPPAFSRQNTPGLAFCRCPSLHNKLSLLIHFNSQGIVPGIQSNYSSYKFLPSRNITVIIFIPLSFLFPLSNPHYCRSTKQLNLHDYTIVKHNR